MRSVYIPDNGNSTSFGIRQIACQEPSTFDYSEAPHVSEDCSQNDIKQCSGSFSPWENWVGSYHFHMKRSHVGFLSTGTTFWVLWEHYWTMPRRQRSVEKLILRRSVLWRSGLPYSGELVSFSFYCLRFWTRKERHNQKMTHHRFSWWSYSSFSAPSLLKAILCPRGTK